MLHALHSACLSHVWLRRRPPSKNKTKVLKISIIEGKYLGFRYLPLIFCVYSARSPSRPRSQKWVKCFPISLYVFPKAYEPIPKKQRMFPKKSTLFPKNNAAFPQKIRAFSTIAINVNTNFQITLSKWQH